MLVIVSDLHFCDGTATPRNVQPGAFRMLQKEIEGLAERNKVQDLDVLFLGDVFDLLRTERWFETPEGKSIPLSLRPWAEATALDSPEHSKATLDHALNIAKEIVEKNREALATLRTIGQSLGIPVRRLYIPGNHDRLYLHDERIRGVILDALGAADGGHKFESERYGLIARHGHEWDEWNFERHDPEKLPSQYSPEDYRITPIGDPITTELVAALPYQLKRRLAASDDFRGRAELEHVYERMQRIEDVRPVVASFNWIFYEAERMHGELAHGQHESLRAALRETVHDLALNFRRLDYYRAWHARHDRLFRRDHADDLQVVLGAFSVLDVNWVGSALASVRELVERFGEEDPCRTGARKELLGAVGKAPLRYVVYGHTHEPLQVALRAEGSHDIYLNSGTWRRREFQADEGLGFVGWDMCSYLVFYDTKEAERGWGGKEPAYEVWSGSRSS